MRPGETRIVLGAAGSGKTTLLKAALGLVKPDSGRVYVFGQDVTDLKEADGSTSAPMSASCFRKAGLFDSMTVAENVAYPLLNQKALRAGAGSAESR